MSEFDDKLNQILSSPETMNQILSIANALTGDSDEGEKAPPKPAAAPPPKGGDNILAGLSGLLQGDSGNSSPLSGLDPAMLTKAATLFQAYQQENDKAALLQAIRPFLRAERAGRIDKAIQMTRLSRVIKLAAELFRKEGEGRV